MKGVVPLEKAHDTDTFGSKAVGLGQALRDGLPVPPGIALAGPVVEAVAAREKRATRAVTKAARPLGIPLAVRSSAVDAHESAVGDAVGRFACSHHPGDPVFARHDRGV